jgi:NADH-quinone oxidoreductase subunit L
MQDLLFLVPLLPLASCLMLLLLAGRLSPMLVAVLGVGSMGLAATLTLFIGIEFIDMGGESFQQVLFNWLPIAGDPLNFGLHLDQLSLVMMGVITGVGWMIHWYADAGVRR